MAITDIETTGLDDQIHEIVEIGLAMVDQNTLALLDEFEIKVRPIHLETAETAALELNGYNEKDWVNASELKTAIGLYAKRTAEAIFLGHNMTFDWSFLSRAFKKTDTKILMDYHRIDLFSLAWFKAPSLPGLTQLNLNKLCKYFRIPEEPKPHRALNGVRSELAVLRKLRALA